MPESVFNDK